MGGLKAGWLKCGRKQAGRRTYGTKRKASGYMFVDLMDEKLEWGLVSVHKLVTWALPGTRPSHPSEI